MISITNLTKRYGQVVAVDDLSINFTPGEMVLIQGPSGSGKTTLLRLIAGLEIPDNGQISIAGEIVSTPDGTASPYGRGIGIVFQRSALWPHMNVAQNIGFAINGNLGQKKAARVLDVLHQTALSDLGDRYPAQLSGGETRRVALARAIAARPHRLLLDEPLTNLDPGLKTQLLDVIIDYARSEGATLLYVTHDLDEAQSLGGRLVQMNAGRIVE